MDPVRAAEGSQAAYTDPWRWGATVVDPEHLRACADRVWQEPLDNPMKGRVPDPFPIDMWARETIMRARYRDQGGKLDDAHGLPELS